MKKILLLLTIVFITCGCENDNKVEKALDLSFLNPKKNEEVVIDSNIYKFGDFDVRYLGYETVIVKDDYSSYNGKEAYKIKLSLVNKSDRANKLSMFYLSITSNGKELDSIGSAFMNDSLDYSEEFAPDKEVFKNIYILKDDSINNIEITYNSFDDTGSSINININK